MARLSHSDHVLQQLNNQREWGFLCDCLIAIGDFYFRAHKAVLAACSSYFRMMFIRDQQGATRLDLSNVQISAECFDLILQLMYLGRIAVGNYEFQELKASMSYLQMYYIPDSLDDLRDLRSSALSPSSSSSTSTAAAAAGKMMFGVRMFEQQRLSAPEAESVAKVVSSSVSRPAPSKQAEEATPSLVAAPPPTDCGGEQPCDLRKRSSGRSSALKERPRFGRTFTCDDCGFVFSCEKLLIEHILTCTNRKALPPPPPHAHDHDDSSKAESSTSDSAEDHRADWLEAKDHLDIRSVAAGMDGEVGPTLTIKTEPEEGGVPEEGGALEADSHQSKDSVWDYDPEPGRSGLDYDRRAATSSDSGVPAKLRRLKEEEAAVPCELCGAELSEDRSAHYLSNHMSHMCACGRCGQVLIKGRQLLEHAERCGDTHESDSHGEDEASLGEEPQGPEGAELSCPHCGLLLQSDGAALEHALTCPDHDPFRTAPTEDEPDHRRKHFCSICGKGFFQRCHLREHYTVHTKEKQFSCSTCGKQFLRERQLRLHTDMHRGMARYVCPVCDQGTFLKHDHVRHMISHLSPGETICQVCFQIFPSGEQLEAHMDVHLYICGVCGEKFRLRKDMRSHYNNTHTRRL